MPLKTLLLLLLAIGCNDTKQATPAASGSSASSSQPSADACAHVGDAVRAIWDRQVSDAPDEATKQSAKTMGDKAVGRLQRHCRDDHWSPEVIQCVTGGSATCTNRMTPEQAQKLNSDKLE